MGDWSKEPWGNDEASDWFAKFWKNNDLNLVIDEVINFDPIDEKFDSIRAACYVLTCFGHVYTWPSTVLDHRVEILSKAISILEKMIDLEDEWGFLDMWGHDLEIIGLEQIQIKTLYGLIDND